MAEVKSPVVHKTQGMAKVIRKQANNTVKQHTFISPKIDFLTVYNASDVDIHFNFNNHDATLADNYRTLKPDAETEPIGIIKGMTFEYTTASGANKRIELTLWG